MPKLGSPIRVTKTLTFRLNALHLPIFFLLLVIIGVTFRQVLVTIQRSQAEGILEGEWGALKGYLQVRGREVIWSYDDTDSEEAYSVGRLRRVFLLTDARGEVLELSPTYQLIGPETPQEIQASLGARKRVWRTRTARNGDAYLLRSGPFMEAGGQLYYVSIGRALSQDEAVIRRFTWTYFSAVPFLIAFRVLIGVYVTKRALRPLNDVAQATELITGSNLSHRIPPRGAGDELDRLIETFNSMIDRLEGSFQQMRQFTTDVSHELRTPVTAIRGQLEVALMTSKTNEQFVDGIQTALEETERLSRFLNAMLQLASAESGQLALLKKRQDLGPVCRDVLEQFRIPAEEARIRLTANLPNECVVEVDRLQFERLLYNLLDNAIKYTPQNGEVSISLMLHGDEVALVVEDTGRGVPAAHLPHIFERFYRVPGVDSSEQRGLGLGLSFVAWIVRAHGGRIDVSSAEGKGSRFEVTLPVTASLTKEAQATGARISA